MRKEGNISRGETAFYAGRGIPVAYRLEKAAESTALPTLARGSTALEYREAFGVRGMRALCCTFIGHFGLRSFDGRLSDDKIAFVSVQLGADADRERGVNGDVAEGKIFDDRNF